MVQIFLPFKNEFCFHSGIWNVKSLSVTSLECVQALNLWWGVSKVSCCWTMWSCTNKVSCSSLKYWNGKGVPCQACTGRVWYPKMETVGLLLFKIFFKDQISTHKTFFYLKDGAEQSHLLYSCKEGLDGCLWTSQLVPSVPRPTTLSSSCFLSCQGGEISFQL